MLRGRDRSGVAVHQVYFGESSGAKKRIPRHFLDDVKAGWVSEILAICQRGEAFGKDRLLQFQHRLTMAAEDVGHARVVRGTSPAAPRQSEVEDAIGDRLFADLRCMMIAAGCRILESDRSPDEAERGDAQQDRPDAEDPSTCGDEADRNARTKSAPPRIENGTYHIVRDRLWAMAVVDGSVVLRAGSEVRALPVETCPGWVIDLREDVQKRGLLAPIPDVDDRLRLVEDLTMTSLSTAGKFVTGRNAPLSTWGKLGGEQ